MKEKKKKIKIVTQELMQTAMVQLRKWQANREAELECPNCGAAGLKIKDRSARPHSEWYAFKCKECGLDDAIHIPMASHRSSM
ncbi:MAG: hypothetical protein KDJ47_12600 [Hyphomicrobiaceae bacterium]|nr:hypothetical protein [Hyphomicrobiaceae bacterium]